MITPKTLEFIADHLPRVTVEDVRRFAAAVDIRDAEAFAAELQAFVHKRVEAMEFAVKYDDGKNPLGLLKADLILVGVSRTSKTPLSMYLAQKKIKVANVPLVPEVPPPDELFQVSPRKVVGLIIDSRKLNEIRAERLKIMRLPPDANYATLNRIGEELEYAMNIMDRIGCPIIDVSNKAIEETANKIMELVFKNGRA